MANNYGTTPWGAYFLNAINKNYYYSARIGRGKTYANTGKVLSIDIKANKVTAKVQGSYGYPYKIELRFDSFEKKEIEKIYSVIEKNPLLFASVINGELPETLLDELEDEGISLFPKNWQNLERSCSCPDWGDPCKHMAGVYFILTSAIDKNPFLLFSLRGVDLIAHYKIKQELSVTYPFKVEYRDNDKDIKDTSSQIINYEPFKDFILSKLKPQPVFMQQDFKKLLDDFYRYSKRNIGFHLYPYKSDHSDMIQRIFGQSKIEFKARKDIYNSKFIITNKLFKQDSTKKLFDEIDCDIKSNKITISPTNLMNLFLAFDDESGNSYYRYLFYIFRVAYLIIESNGFILDIIDKESSFLGVFKPLTSPVSIQKQLHSLHDITPLIATFFNEKKFFDETTTNEIILSSLISEYVLKIDFPLKRGRGNKFDLQIFEALFCNKAFKNTHFETKDFAKSIDNYFAIFDLLNSNLKFKIFINPHDDEYSLSIKVNDKYLHEYQKSEQRLEILSLLVKFSEDIYEIKTLINKPSVVLSKERLEEFILSKKDFILDLGIDIILPKELKNLLKPKLQIKVKSSSNSFQSFLSLDKLLEYDYEIAIGDAKISHEEFKRLLKQGQELIKFRDSFVILNAKEVENIFKNIEKNKTLNRYELLHMSLNDEIELDVHLQTYLKELFSFKEFTQPQVNANLREYQSNGFNWAINNLLNGFGVIFADDMGLGKTLQTITVLKYLKEENYLKNPAIIVLPTTLLGNWANEIEKFAPTLTFSQYYGTKREFEVSDLVFTTYHVLQRDLDKLKKHKFDAIVIDEAQKIKNPQTQITKAVKSIKAKYKIALSGTPVENNLSELWSIFDFAMPKYLKTLKIFQKEYAKDIEISKDTTKAQQLKNITAPFMLRRLKTDKTIIKDLPEKIITDSYITMEKSQAILYKSLVDNTLKTIEDSEANERSGLIFKLITSLKQICNHPRNFDKKSDFNPELSGKTKYLLELLDTILQRDEKTLIFTQYTQMGDILEKFIEEQLYTTPLYLKGSQSKNKRDQIVESFQNDPNYKIFILSLKAGGTGLNLTQANNVIHFDLWFNPAVENQATDRAFRIGQNKNVNVFRFITKNSFEEKIDKMIKSKMALQDLSVAQGESWIGKMSDEELKKLFV